jgi:uncharacterized membrane protein YfhO
LVDLEVNCQKGGDLVLSDNYYPGWKAFVDGRAAVIKRVKYLFRGVEVPEGKHQVRFIYDPASVKIGALISAAALLALIGLMILSGKVNKNAV